MTQPARADGPRLTRAEDLLFEVAIARHRLGDTLYHVESRHRPTAKSLAAKGLLHVESGSVEKSIRVGLTALGEIVGISATYTPPALSTTCRSFYFGPKTSGHRLDCDKRNHHKGKHRNASFGAVVVTWTDKEAGGRDHEHYGLQIRANEANGANEKAALRAAIAEGRLDWSTGQITH